MKLADFVCLDALIPRLASTQRDGAITELVEALHRAGKLRGSKAADVAKAVIRRENEASTGIGKGVAVPHVKHPAARDVIAALGCSDKGIEFASLDKQPVYTVFLLLSPADNADKHLQAMEAIFQHLNKDDFRRFMRQVQTVEDIKDLILEADEAAGN